MKVGGQQSLRNWSLDTSKPAINLLNMTWDMRAQQEVFIASVIRERDPGGPHCRYLIQVATLTLPGGNIKQGGWGAQNKCPPIRKDIILYSRTTDMKRRNKGSPTWHLETFVSLQGFTGTRSTLVSVGHFKAVGVCGCICLFVDPQGSTWQLIQKPTAFPYLCW